MSFIGATQEGIIKTNGKTFKIFITEQDDGKWIATILCAINGLLAAMNIDGETRENAYIKACEWTWNVIDSNATIEPLLMFREIEPFILGENQAD